MAGILVKAGDDMPLHAQLGDYATGKYVRAILRDDDGTFIKNVDLTDRGDGIYTGKEPMPSKNVLSTYAIFNDAGYSEQSEDQDAGIDIFILDTVISQRRDDKIIGVIDDHESISGALAYNSVIGVLDADEAVCAQIEDAGQIVAGLEDDEITASFKCEV